MLADVLVTEVMGLNSYGDGPGVVLHPDLSQASSLPASLQRWPGMFIPCSSPWNCCEGAKPHRSMTLSKAGVKVIVESINNKVQTAGLYVM